MYDQIFLFGDSITQGGYDNSGWVASLSHAFVRRLVVINGGMNGYNTTQALKVLPKVVSSSASPQSRIRFMTIFFGANDARLPNDDPAAQHISLTDFKENLKNIITHPNVRAQNPKIILFTPPPMDEKMCEANDASRGIFKVRRTAKTTASYAQAVREVGTELEIPVLDLWTAFMKYAGWKEGEPLPGSREVGDEVLPTLLSDGLHLTAKGNQLVFQELMAFIEKTWPEETPEKLPSLLPLWDDVSAWKDF